MEQLFFYKNFGKDIFHCEQCGSMTVIDKVEERIVIYRGSESKEEPAVELGRFPMNMELCAKIRGGECPVCAGWEKEDGQKVSL